jgi:CheY-like chemotaxis protein
MLHHLRVPIELKNMAVSLEQKKIFIIVTPNEDRQNLLSSYIHKHFNNIQVFQATDGTEALYKIENVPPHVVLMDWELSKLSGQQLAQHLIEDKKMDGTAIIVCSEPPEHEFFVDEVVKGRVQFINAINDESKMIHSINRALNDFSKLEKTEFHLRFLAPGDFLIKEGEKADSVYLVKRGSLNACHREAEQVLVLGSISAGEFVGEMSYINGEHRSADVEAVTDCELIEIPIGVLDQVIFRKPSWAKALMQTLSRRLKTSNEVRVSKKIG